MNEYLEYFQNQLGHGTTQRHYADIGTVFSSRKGLRGFGAWRHQRGLGFGSFFTSLLRTTVPWIKKALFPALKPVLQQSAVNLASNLVSDIVQGDNVATAIKRNITSEGKKLLTNETVATEGRKLLAKAPDVIAQLIQQQQHKQDDDVITTKLDRPKTGVISRTPQAPRISRAAGRGRVTSPGPSRKKRRTTYHGFPGLKRL